LAGIGLFGAEKNYICDLLSFYSATFCCWRRDLKIDFVSFYQQKSIGLFRTVFKQVFPEDCFMYIADTDNAY